MKKLLAICLLFPSLTQAKELEWVFIEQTYNGYITVVRHLDEAICKEMARQFPKFKVFCGSAEGVCTAQQFPYEIKYSECFVESSKE